MINLVKIKKEEEEDDRRLIEPMLRLGGDDYKTGDE